MHELYKEREDINNWLHKYRVRNYTLVPDEQYGYIVDVNGSVDLDNKNLSSIDVKFGIIRGNFSCSGNNLTSLEGSPNEVTQIFFCNYNKLSTLEHCPQKVGCSFVCVSNELTTLDFLPAIVGDIFILQDNPGLGKYQECESLVEILVEKERRLLSANIRQATATSIYKI